eukprot:GILK01006585.1.p1 GENE.GILK01006585.1~~GILK01006585.1.p1  ORF type:complete len:396 (-),score=42.06 GILK01006585.1:203-1357(-)
MSKLVLVTGVAGYLASHIVAILLRKGYRVRGTVRSLTNGKTKALLEALTAEFGAGVLEQRLSLVEADVLSGDWAAVLTGSDFLIHTACPVIFNPKSANDVIEPALSGTLRVLRAAANVHTIRRVVYTSSTAAVCGHGHERGVDHVFDEQDFNLTDTAEDNPYSYAKTEAEKAVWSLVEEHPHLSVGIINPAILFGPTYYTLQDVESLGVLRSFLNGEYPGYPALGYGYTDVRDAANAHVLAMEDTSKTTERYIVVSESMFFSELAARARKLFPDFPIPRFPLPNVLVYAACLVDSRLRFSLLRKNLGRLQRFSTKKFSAKFGIPFTPFEKTLVDSCESMIKNGEVTDYRLPRSKGTLISTTILGVVVFISLVSAFLWTRFQRAT